MLPSNKVVRLLIASDFLTFASWGFLSPVLAIFVLDSINGGNATVAGFTVGIYWVIKSLLQVPIGKYLDRKKGERDDYWFMVIGLFIGTMSPLLFIVSSEPWHIYGAQVIHAIGMAIAVPAWAGIFTRHIDKGREAETWSFESSALGIGAGVTGIAGGIIATEVGFTPIFLLITLFGLLGIAALLKLKNRIIPRTKNIPPIRKSPIHVTHH